ncbi:MAG: hypothetical protein QOG80_615 [Pseudonocardiales bacterium]|jgi:hypothetical protein|nr:hypothetical protein [Pseudonocardiales bacterium]
MAVSGRMHRFRYAGVSSPPSGCRNRIGRFRSAQIVIDLFRYDETVAPASKRAAVRRPYSKEIVMDDDNGGYGPWND